MDSKRPDSATKHREPRHKAFDYERSLSRLGGDPRLFSEIVSLFFEDAPQLLARARECIRQQNLPELERAVHSLKGLSANFEAKGMSTIAMIVEEHARNRDLERALACFPDLEREFETLRSELAALSTDHNQQGQSEG